MNVAFAVAGGSTIGRHHKESQKNNQDAFYYKKGGHLLVGVVCDGCSSAKASEVGSSLGSIIVAETVYNTLHHSMPEKTDSSTLASPSLWEAIRQQIIIKLLSVVHTIGGDTHDTIRDYFLFTIVGFAVTQKELIFFSIGDGYIVVNGIIERKGPFANNQPPYIAYDIPGNEFLSEKDELRFVLTCIPIEKVSSALIATDGLEDFIEAEYAPIPGRDEHVGPLSQFWEHDIYIKNPDVVRRKLARINTSVPTCSYSNEEGHTKRTEAGLLRDDTTLIVIVRADKEAKG